MIEEQHTDQSGSLYKLPAWINDKVIKVGKILCFSIIAIIVLTYIASILPRSVKRSMMVDFSGLDSFLYIVLFIVIMAGFYKYLSGIGLQRAKYVFLALLIFSAVLISYNYFITIKGTWIRHSGHADMIKQIRDILEAITIALYLLTGILLVKSKDNRIGGISLIGFCFIFKALIVLASLVMAYYMQIRLSELRALDDEGVEIMDMLLELKQLVDLSKSTLNILQLISEIVIYSSFIYILVRIKRYKAKWQLWQEANPDEISKP